MRNYATNTTHLLWIGRWVELNNTHGDTLTFKNGRDAADLLLWPESLRSVETKRKGTPA